MFFKYDLEPMSVVIRERTTSLYQFLIRLAGVVGQSRKKLVVVFGFIADKNKKKIHYRRSMDSGSVCAPGV